MTAEALPRRDGARPVLRLAFTLAWSAGALLALAIVVTVANAAAPADAPGACTRLDDDRARLACYDALFPRTGATPAAASAPEAAFGANEQVRRARGESVPTPERIESTLTQVDVLEPGRTRVTLANGQVWEQIDISTRFRPRTGDTLTVRQASLGSYLMRAGSGAAVRARRVR